MEDINQIIEKVCNTYEQDQYAMYLRKSRADLEMEALGEGETLARHRHKLEELAARLEIHPDQITVYHELVSGESIDDRPEMQKLLSDVYSKKYKGVLVVEVERLARGNTKDQGEVADAFQSSNTKIITPSKIYDPNDEFDQEYFEFGLFMSRREYKTIRRRMVAGKLQAVQEGNYIPSVRPFGYNVVRTSKKDRILVPHPEEAKVVQMIFDWWTEDKKSIGWIATELTKMGIQTVRNMPEWHRETIRGMLDNVLYIGLIRWNQSKTIKEFDPKTGKLVKRRRKTEVEHYPGKHEAIISKEQFDKAQARFRKMPPLELKKRLVNPLAGILRCDKCGRCMEWQPYPNDIRKTRYTHPRSLVCKKKSVYVETVLDAVVDGLKAYIKDFEIKMENGTDQTQLINHQEKIKILEAELAKQEKRRKKLFDDYESEDSVYTKEEFLERKQVYNQTIDNLKHQISEAKANMPELVNYEEQILHLHQMIDCIRDPELSANAKNDFLKEYIDSIEYDVICLGHKQGGKPILNIHLK